MKGADVVFGLSQKDAFSAEMIRSMADKPIIFAMANPDPEITPEEVARIRDDAIMATGRSDYPNQVNNVLGFPYIFRGALDVRASTINDEMKIAAVKALASLAREDVPDDVVAAYQAHRGRVRGAIHHPRALRSAPDFGDPGCRCASGDRKRRCSPRDARHGCLCPRTLARRDPIASTLAQLLRTRAPASESASFFAEAEEEQVMQTEWRQAALSTRAEACLAGQADRQGGQETVRCQVVRGCIIAGSLLPPPPPPPPPRGKGGGGGGGGGGGMRAGRKRARGQTRLYLRRA